MTEGYAHDSYAHDSIGELNRGLDTEQVGASFQSAKSRIIQDGPAGGGGPNT